MAAYEDTGAAVSAEKPGKPKKDGKPLVMSEVLKRYYAAAQHDKDNRLAAYEDLAFRAGDQWPDSVKRQREADGNRPCLTINMLPQFIRQVTGDIRQMRPAIKVLPVDNQATDDVAENIAGLIRYIENRSEAQAAYFNAADSMVAAGIGHLRVTTEYASQTTFNQEISIEGIEDGVGVIWDPDAIKPTREDAMYCFVPVDMSHESFAARYPDATLADFNTDTDAAVYEGWYNSETIRVCEYWLKEKIKKRMALGPDGSVYDLSDGEDALPPLPPGQTYRMEDRDTFKVCRYLITGHEVLEKTDWPGSHIPIVPMIGEEVKVARRIVRHGVIRFAKDPQRIYNYMRSAQVEIKALQPKAPFIGTEDMFKNHLDYWETANTANHPFLPFTPDPKAAGAAPQRVQPPVTSPGLTEEVALSANDMKAVIGIYDAQLGAKSNETSGRAILARQQEGDTGTFVYKDNFGRALRRTGQILIDLIPKIYDTQRRIRIIGEDGKHDLIEVNKPVGMIEEPLDGGEPMGAKVENDLTVGAYDVVVELGPSYSTKQQEARDGIQTFIQAAPQIAPLVMDLVAKGQDWPLADKIGKRLETLLPPEIRAQEREESGEDEAPPMPNPQEQMQAQMQQMQMEMQAQAAQFELRTKEAQARKAEADAAKAEAEAMAVTNAHVAPAEGAQGDPLADPRMQELAGAVDTLNDQMQEVINVVREIAPPVMDGMHGETQKQSLMQTMAQLTEAISGMQAAQMAPKSVSLVRDKRGQIVGGTVGAAPSMGELQ